MAYAKDRVAIEEWRLSVIEKYKNLDIKKPELFNVLVTQELDNKAEYLYSWLFLDKIETERYLKLEFVYAKYTFVSAHVERLIKQLEGALCCGDKACWILNKYLDYVRNGVVPQDAPCWHIPKQDPKLWFAWIDTMAELYYGNITPYTQTLAALTNEQNKPEIQK